MKTTTRRAAAAALIATPLAGVAATRDEAQLGAVSCGECGWGLELGTWDVTVSGDYVYTEEQFLHCNNPNCSRKDIRYRVPTIPLERV